jgi:hypothetical protein
MDRQQFRIRQFACGVRIPCALCSRNQFERISLDMFAFVHTASVQMKWGVSVASFLPFFGQYLPVYRSV